MRVDPDHAAALPAAAARPASVPIAIEWSPPRTSGRRAVTHGLLDQRREPRARPQDLRQVPRALVENRERLRLGRDDVARSETVGRLRVSLSSSPAYRIADGPMSTPRRAWPRSSGAPMIDTGRSRADLPLPGAPKRGATLGGRGEVAQLVEHTAENRGVAGSSPALAITWTFPVPSDDPEVARRRPGTASTAVRAARRARSWDSAAGPDGSAGRGIAHPRWARAWRARSPPGPREAIPAANSCAFVLIRTLASSRSRFDGGGTGSLGATPVPTTAGAEHVRIACARRPETYPPTA